MPTGTAPPSHVPWVVAPLAEAAMAVMAGAPRAACRWGWSRKAAGCSVLSRLLGPPSVHQHSSGPRYEWDESSSPTAS